MSDATLSVHIRARVAIEPVWTGGHGWLDVGPNIALHCFAPEDAERLAEAATALARRMRERAQPMTLEEMMAREG